MSDRAAAIKAKVTALRAKTTEAGCTEAEALAAAEAAARLMDQHGLAEADLVMGEAEAHASTGLTTWRREISLVIARCTNTAVVITPRRGGSSVLFVGREPGPEVAVYLRDVCFRAVETALGQFHRSPVYTSRRKATTRRAATDQFCSAMSRRLSRRLFVLFRSTIDDAALAVAEAALDRRFPDVVMRKVPGRKIPTSAASLSGLKAGDSVSLHHGVSDSDVPGALPAPRAALPLARHAEVP